MTKILAAVFVCVAVSALAQTPTSPDMEVTLKLSELQALIAKGIADNAAAPVIRKIEEQTKPKVPKPQGSK
jgi:hypothetical protein